MAFDSGAANACSVRPSSCLLPSEILHSVISHAEPRQMKDLALVSRDFHDTVSSILYRRIHHTFTEADDEDGLIPVDLLAAVLETLAGGDHNYAKYIKSFSIDAESSSSAKKISHELKYDCSSGKLLNALLLAALKNASTLETFSWDIRVELSQSFLLALSQKTTLQHLHLRLQKGPSLHSRSIMNTFHSIPPSNPPVTNVHHHHHHPDYISPNQNIFIHPNPPATYVANHHAQLNNNARLGRKLGTAKLTDIPKNISRFSNLKTLAILDIDDYEYIPEVAECVANSAHLLRTLKLSFSKTLARRTRTKVASENTDAGTSADDDDDDFHPILPHPPPQFMAAQNESPGSPSQLPSTMAEVRKDRHRQEEALSAILGISNATHHPSIDRMFEIAIMAAQKDIQRAYQKTADRNVAFTKVVGKVADDLLSSSRRIIPRDKHALEKISKAAEIYIKNEKIQQSIAKADSNSGQAPTVTKSVSEDDVAGPSSPTKGDLFDNKLFDYLEKLCEDSSHPPVFPFDWQDEKPASANSGLTSPSKHTEVNNPKSSASPLMNTPSLPALYGEESHLDEPSTAANSLDNEDKDAISDIVDMEHPDIVDESDEDQQSADEAEGWASKEPLQVDNAKGKMPELSSEPSTKKEEKGFGFLRAGHGICLENLSLYLIPVRASVLFKGIDVPRLKHLSLLNVGSQAAFWSMLSKLPDPAQLTSIHTDHVTEVFLHALSGLECVTELFLFEQNQKTSKVAPLTPPTTVGMKDIRQKVLKSHLGNLRRLVIRNEHNSGWKFDVKSISTLSNRGANLKELMIEVNSEGLHCLMQQIAKFRSLSALHILFNIRDNSNTLLREMRYNIADTICHCAIHVTQLKESRPGRSFNQQEEGKLREQSVLSPAVSDAGPIDGFDTDEEAEWPSLILKKDLKRSAVEEVKMWQRDIWGMKL
ncbi:hypothetical protein PISL3812_06317 [Talaromyces islandicus]|uniref:F-box domain-containing protein n=1 Tax=Talaromyces islandicus TaxID=28573 RepID=A0A0U1M2S4_TALIS|nr:hypothetical protein PISL3812_06317 [Talaromyces islandicus]